MEEKRNYLFLNNLVIRIIALITMTIDHIGVFLTSFPIDNQLVLSVSSPGYIALRVIGRIAFPLFVFLMAEGVTHTKNIKKYLLNLGIMALIIAIAITFISSPIMGINLNFFGNIFLDLFFYVLVYYLFTHPNKKVRPLVSLPILFMIIMFILKIYISENDFSGSYLLGGLYFQYDLLGLLLFIGILVSYKIIDRIVKKAVNNDEELFLAFKNTKTYQFHKNIGACVALTVVSLICCILSMVLEPDYGLSFVNFGRQSYMILAFLFIIFYNGKLGYRNKIIKGAFYLYYPLHIVIIFLIILLINAL